MLNPVIVITPTPEKIKILSYNINHGEDTNQSYGFNEIIKIIKKENPDFVCLNDVEQECVRTYRENQVQKIAESLGMEYTFGEVVEIDGGWNGNAILSKYPLIFSGNRLLKKQGQSGIQAYLQTTYRVGDLKLHIYTSELSKDESIAEKQIEEITEKILDNMSKLAINDPIILTGTFNLLPNHNGIKEIEKYFLNSYDKIKGNKNTYPSNSPIHQYDYIFHRKNIRLESASVINNSTTRNCSRHLPVVTIFKLR